MENAAEALVMAGSILLLIIALTVSISSFTTLKVQLDSIIEQREATDMAIDEDGNYINYIKNANDIRTVGVETIISSIRRLRREEYTVYIYITPATLNSINNSIISNLEDLGIIIQTTKAQEYDGTEIIPVGADILQFTLAGTGYQNVTNNDVLETLSNIIIENNLSFYEYLGTYQVETAEEVSSENKVTYRIVTYVQVV